jgi:hypothetical protein
MIELLITNEGVTYIPVVKDSVKWEVSSDGSAGKLTFEVYGDGILKVQEGNEVRLRYKNEDVFFGFVFSKKSGKDNWISITAYDQLRYLKNKYSYLYENNTVTSAIKELANTFQLRLGQIDDTEYLIESLVEDDETLLDIILAGLNETITKSKKKFVLYDEFGKLTLTNMENMYTAVLIDASTIEDFSYESSIDSDTYNRVILYYDPDDDTKTRQYFKAEDVENVKKWGMLLYYESVKAPSIGQSKADAILALKNKKTRKLSIKGGIGNLKVRAGCLVVVNLKLEDTLKQSYMMVSKVTHTFTNDNHTMDLQLEGAWED